MERVYIGRSGSILVELCFMKKNSNEQRARLVRPLVDWIKSKPDFVALALEGAVPPVVLHDIRGEYLRMVSLGIERRAPMSAGILNHLIVSCFDKFRMPPYEPRSRRIPSLRPR